MIDGHSHMLMDRDRTGTKRRSVRDLVEIDFAGLFEQMDTVGLEKIVSIVQETTRVGDEWLGTNELVIDLQNTYPDRFMGVFGAEPLDRSDKLNTRRLDEFKAAARDHGIRGLFLGPPYSHFYANDERIYPFYEAAVAHDAVVYLHHAGGCGGGGGAAYRAPMKYARPVLLDDVVIAFPDLNIHVEHMAYPWAEELFALMKRAPNVYTDVCRLFGRPTILAWYLVMAKEYGVIDRVIWGTDYDVYKRSDFDFSIYFDRIQRETSWIRQNLHTILERSGWPNLTQDEVEGILDGNWKRLHQLDCRSNSGLT